MPGSHLLWVAGHPPSLAEDRRAQLTEPGGFVLIDLFLGECVRLSSLDVLSLTCARPNSTTVGAELSARVGAHVYGGFRSRDPPAASGQGGRQPRSRHGAHRRRPDPHRPTPGKTGTRSDHGTIHARLPTLQFHSVPRLRARPSVRLGEPVAVHEGYHALQIGRRLLNAAIISGAGGTPTVPALGRPERQLFVVDLENGEGEPLEAE